MGTRTWAGGGWNKGTRSVPKRKLLNEIMEFPKFHAVENLGLEGHRVVLLTARAAGVNGICQKGEEDM